MVQLVLTKAGFTVEAAADGEDGVEVGQAEPRGAQKIRLLFCPRGAHDGDRRVGAVVGRFVDAAVQRGVALVPAAAPPG